MTDCLDWEKISQEFYKDDEQKKDTFLQFTKDKSLNNFEDLDKNQGEMPNSEDFQEISALIQVNLNMYSISTSSSSDQSQTQATGVNTFGVSPTRTPRRFQKDQTQMNDSSQDNVQGQKDTIQQEEAEQQTFGGKNMSPKNDQEEQKSTGLPQNANDSSSTHNEPSNLSYKNAQDDDDSKQSDKDSKKDDISPSTEGQASINNISGYPKDDTSQDVTDAQDDQNRKYGAQIKLLEQLLSENQEQDLEELIQQVIDELNSENIESLQYNGFEIYEINKDVGMQILNMLSAISSQEISKEIEAFLRYRKFCEDLPPEIQEMEELQDLLLAIQQIDFDEFTKNYKVLSKIKQEDAIQVLQLVQAQYQEAFSLIEDEKLIALIKEQPVVDQKVYIQYLIDQNDSQKLVSYVQEQKFDLNQIMELLDLLLTQQKESLYNDLIINSQEIFKTDQEYSKQFTFIEKNQRIKSSEKIIQKRIETMSNVQPHFGYSLYLSFKDKLKFLKPTNPFEKQNAQQQKINDIIVKVEGVLNRIGYDQLKIKDFLSMITQNKVNDILNFAQNIRNFDRDAFLEILDIIQEISEEIKEYYNFARTFQQMRVEMQSQGIELYKIKDFLSSIDSNQFQQYIDHVNQVLFLETKQANEAHIILKSFFPQVVELIPVYKLILLETMDIYTKQLVSELIDYFESFKQNPNTQPCKDKIDELNNMLDQIFKQNIQIFNLILEKYGSLISQLGLKNPASQQNTDFKKQWIDAIAKQDKQYLLQQFEEKKNQEDYKQLFDWALSKAQQSNQQFYESLIIQPVVPNIDKSQYDQVKRYLEQYSKKPEKAPQCQAKIDDYYESHPHLATSLFLHYNNKQVQLISPQQVYYLQQSLYEYQNELDISDNTTPQTTQMLQSLMEIFEDKSFPDFIEKILEIQQINKIVGNKLIEIVKRSSPYLNQLIQNELTYDLFIESLPEKISQNQAISEFLKSLKNQDIEKVNKYLTHISSLSQEQISILLEAVKRYYPDIYKNLSQDQILLLQCPADTKMPLQNIISSIQAFDQQIHSDKDIKQCEMSLSKINELNKEFYEKIVSTLGSKFQQMNVNLPKSIKETQQEDFIKINHILEQRGQESKLKIQQFYEVDVNFNYQESEQQLIDRYRQNGKFPRELLTQIMFHIIKRRLDFSHLIDKFIKFDISFPITRSILILYLLENADESLRILLVAQLSQYIPVPLYGISWKHLSVQQSLIGEENLNVVIPKELIYVYERFKSVLNFSISSATSNKDYPQGTDKFINKLFLKNFESVNKKYSNYGTIEIQFDYNFSTPQYIPVANCNGPLSIGNLKKVQSIFNVFILHINQSIQQGLEYLSQFLEVIQNNQIMEKLIIIIDHNNSQEITEFTEEKHNQTLIYKFKVHPYNQMDESMQKNLCHEILNKIKNFQMKKSEQYITNMNERLATIQTFSEMLKFNTIQNDDVNTHLTNINSMIQTILKNHKQLHSQDFLPMNYLFQQSCELNYSIHFDNDLDRATIKQKDDQRCIIQDQMKSQKESPILKDLVQIIKSKNTLGSFMIIHKIIKGFLDDQLKEIQAQREEMRDQIKKMEQQQKNPNNNDDTQMMEKLKSLQIQEKALTQQMGNQSFSYEFIIRELYLLSQYIEDKKGSKDKYLKDYRNLCSQLLNNTEAFEIIDGNNLAFVEGVYDKYYSKNRDDGDIFVISVIGPQSSGKSLLLNFLFGTQFQSAQGRCTKGVYGAIINLKTEGDKKRKILILDTEGIQAAEARDERFDSRIVFYSLCVSHVVIICNKGDINSQMQETLKLAAESISKLKENIIKPSVFIVMNMLSSTDNASKSQCIEKLSSAIKELGSSEDNTQQLCTITSENVFLLPYAFDKAGNREFTVNQPSLQFAAELEVLKVKILQCIQQVYSQNGKDLMSVSQWFSFACKYWNFTEKFKGMMDFKNPEQKKQEGLIKIKINSIIENEFENKQEINKQIIEEIVNNDLQQFKGNQSIHFDIIFNKIESSIFKFYIEIEKKQLDNFKAFCSTRNASYDIINKNLRLLEGQMNYYKEQWINQAREIVSEFVEKKSKKIGFAKLNEAISRLLKIKKKYSLDEAEEHFVKEWKAIEDEIISMQRKESIIREDTYKFVRNLYNQEMGTVFYANNQKESLIMTKFQAESNEALLHEIQGIQDALLYFTGSTVQPSSENLIGALTMNKQFIQNLDSNVIDVHSSITIYDWKKLLQERIDRKFLEQKLMECHEFQYGSCDSYNIDILEDKKENLYINLSEELSHVGIKIRRNFIEEALELAQTLKDGPVGYQEWYHGSETQLPILIQQFIDRTFYEETDKYFQCDEINDDINFNDSYNYQFVRTAILSSRDYKEADNVFDINQYMYDINNSSQNLTGALEVSNKNKLQIDKQGLLPIDVRQYMIYLASNSRSSQMSDQSDATLAAMEYVTNMLNLEAIIQEIETIVIKKVKCNGEQEAGETITTLIADLKTDKGDELKTKLRKISRNVIQEVAMDVKQIILQLNEDLERFAFKLSEKGTSLIHLIAQVFLVALSEQLLIKIEQSSIDTLRIGKQIQKQLFISKLTSNQEEQDQALATKLVKLALDFLIKKYTEEAKIEFEESFKRLSVLFNKRSFIIGIENSALIFEKEAKPIKSYSEYKFLNQQNKDFQKNYNVSVAQNDYINAENDEMTLYNILYFFIDPRNFFNKWFNTQWKDFIVPEMKNIKENFSRKLNKSLNEIYVFFEQLQQFIIKSNTNEPSVSLFITADDQESCQENINELANKAAAQYITLVVKKEFPKDKIVTIDNIKMRCGLDSKPLPNHFDMDKSIDEDLASNIKSSLKGEQVSNIENFLKFVNKETDSVINMQTQLQNEIQIIGDKMQLLKEKFVGCDKFCPLCRMQCDAEHRVDQLLEDRIHECSQGHRIQGFGGNMISNKNAVIITCSDLKDNNNVVHQGKVYKWTNFKQIPEFKNWKFSSNDQTQNVMNKNKYVSMWNYFGPLLCEIYRRKQSIDIKFIRAEHVSRNFQEIHYILLLDTSGSMEGQRWDELMKSVRAFMEAVTDNTLIQKHSKVTTVTHNDYVQEIFEDKIPDMKLLDQIKFVDGGNDFAEPLKYMKKCMNKYIDNYDKFVVCFMTDGQDRVPIQVLEEIAADTKLMNKLDFRGILQGNCSGGIPILQAMCDKLNGTMVQCIDVEQLKEEFMNLVPNVYE
eukprot:403348639